MTSNEFLSELNKYQEELKNETKKLNDIGIQIATNIQTLNQKLIDAFSQLDINEENKKELSLQMDVSELLATDFNVDDFANTDILNEMQTGVEQTINLLKEFEEEENEQRAVTTKIKNRLTKQA